MDILLISLIFIVLIITGIIFSIIIANYNEYNIKNYYTNLSFKKNNDFLKNCPKGCVKGFCNHNFKCINSDKNNCCIYDFQCNYCKDNITQNIYSNLNINKNNLNNLNEKIKKENDYIFELNKKIKIINEKNGY